MITIGNWSNLRVLIGYSGFSSLCPFWCAEETRYLAYQEGIPRKDQDVVFSTVTILPFLCIGILSLPEYNSTVEYHLRRGPEKRWHKTFKLERKGI